MEFFIALCNNVLLVSLVFWCENMGPPQDFVARSLLTIPICSNLNLLRQSFTAFLLRF